MGNPGALKKLEKISQRAQNEDVFLVCYGGLYKAYHRRILLRLAEEWFNENPSVDGVEPK